MLENVPGNPRRLDANYSHRGRSQSGFPGPTRSHHSIPITYSTLKKLSQETAEPCDIVKKFTEDGTGLSDFLKENLTNFDCIELVMVVIGGFCSKNGVAEFANGFIKIVKVYLFLLLYCFNNPSDIFHFFS